MIGWNSLNRLTGRVAGAALSALFIIGCAASDMTRPVEVSPSSGPGRMKAFNPFIVSDPVGRVYVSFYGQSEGEQPGLYVTRSTDGGRTWLGEPIRIEAAQPQGRRIGFHRLEHDGRGNVYVIWSIEYAKSKNRWRTAEVKRRHSKDNGVTWSDAPVVWSPDPDRLINYPTPRTGRDGELQIVFTVEQNGNEGLFFTRTIQGGTAWLPEAIRIDHPPLNVNEPPGSKSQRHPPTWPTVAHDTAGRIFVVWQEKRAGSPEAIYFNRSLNQGTTWSQEDTRVDRSTVETSISRMPVLSTGAQGSIYVAWEDSRNGRSDIFFNRSLDRGDTWPAKDVQLNPDPPKWGSAANPVISSDSQDRVYVGWKEVGADSSTLLFTQSSDQGTTWPLKPRELASGGKDTAHEAMRLAHSDDGHVYMAWGEYTNKKQAIVFNGSSDLGATWLSPPLSLNHGETTHVFRLPRLNANGKGVIYVVWSSNKSGGLDLFLNRSTDHGKTWLAQEVQITR